VCSLSCLKLPFHFFPIKMSSVSVPVSASSSAASAPSAPSARSESTIARGGAGDADGFPGTPPFGETASEVAEAAEAAEVAEAADAAKAASASVAAYEVKLYKTFDEMPFVSKNENLLRGIYAYGFEKPSLIQQQAIVPIAEGHDVLAQAPSGTGKTPTYAIGSLTKLNPDLNEVQIVVLAPVRELAEQIAKVYMGIGSCMGVRAHVATGGPPVREDILVIQQQKMKAPHVPHVVVATPGRLYDLLNRRVLSPDTVRVLVLDEADQLLESRFREQIHAILSLKWSSKTQVALLSATMIEEMKEIAKTLLNDHPVEITLEAEEVSLEGIKQWYVPVGRDEDKLDTLCDLYDHLNIQQANIFVNTRKSVLDLADAMKKRGFDLDYTHGDMDVSERKARMEAFRTGKTRVLISTDMLSRGIDVQQVSIVINYELPLQRENYIHRIGRSGRFGRKGASINLVSDREMRAQAEIEEFYGKKVMPLPMDLNIF
jgi:translation initiation factor 4A